MNYRFLFFTLGAAISVCLGLVPLLVAFAHQVDKPMMILASFACLGWLAVGMLLMRQRQIFFSVRKAVDEIGLTDVRGGLTELITGFAKESTRFHRSQYAYRAGISGYNASLSVNLWKVIELTKELLNAQAVELSLFDEESGMCSQAMIVGSPSCVESQTMLSAGEERSLTKASGGEADGRVVAKAVTFAGTVFGALRVEFEAGRVLSNSDRQVLHLLALQGGILLVDARFTEEALRMRRLSDETSRAKTGFLANLSHEIRGPLGTILNASELALDGLCGEVGESLLEMLNMIKDSGDHLLDLVNDVLDYAKVEAGKVIVTPVDNSLKEMLEDLVAVVRAQALAKNHNLELLDVEPSLGVLCDKRHARQMLINFLTNAVKYTPNGGSIKVWASRMANNRVKISIQDTGIGIPENQRHKVFGAFERVEHSYALEQLGTGLGMPLTRSLAEVNGGSVGFDSVEGQGSTFWLMLPAVEIAEPELVSDEDGEHPAVAQGRGEVILLVDNDGDSRQLVERYLENQGFRIFQATTGAEVMKILREHPVELAVVENDLPGLPGEEMVATIRSMPQAATVPIILLSARAFVFDIERFLKLGVDRCLSKPVALSELALNARKLIDGTRQLDPISTVH